MHQIVLDVVKAKNHLSEENPSASNGFELFYMAYDMSNIIKAIWYGLRVYYKKYYM